MVKEKRESDMVFEYDDCSVFLPEESPTYKDLCKGNSIKSCDFLFYRNNKLIFIEVKKSAPNPNNPEAKKSFDDYLSDIHFKMIHSILLFIGLTGLREFSIASKLPENLAYIEIKKQKIQPMLIIKEQDKKWIPQISDCLRKEMKGTKKAFALEDIVVLNQDDAKKFGIIKQ